MIDFHSHVLPKMDDGAKDVETALAMLEESKRQGVTTVVCTPHYYGKKRSPKQFIEKREEAYAMLAGKIPDGIQLRFGAEVYFSKDAVTNFEDLSLLCIDGTDYIMLELPFTPTLDPRLFERLEAFIDETDCIPIIAHVDRYPSILKNPSLLKRLTEMGNEVVLCIDSFTVKGVKNFAFALLKKGMVHAVGTDMHNMTDRAPVMEILETTLRTLPAEIGEKLAQSETDILANRKLVPTVKSVRKLFGKYF